MADCLRSAFREVSTVFEKRISTIFSTRWHHDANGKPKPKSYHSLGTGPGAPSHASDPCKHGPTTNGSGEARGREDATAEPMNASTNAETILALRCGRPGCPCMRPAGYGRCRVHGLAHDDYNPSLSVSERGGKPLAQRFNGQHQGGAVP